MKLNIKPGFFLLLTGCLVLTSCREVFEPEIEDAEKVIVVDALVTDQVKEHYVKINYAVNYNDDSPPEPITNAEVWLEDKNGEQVHFPEKNPGVYISPEGFKAEQGNFYVLNIITSDSKTLRSYPQEVLGISGIEDIYGRFAEKPVPEINTYGDLFYYTYEGTESFIDIKDPGNEMPKMRYVPKIMLLYGYWTPDTVNPAGPEVMMYCWRKYNSIDLPSVNFTGLQQGNSGLKSHYLMFIPEDKSFYALAPDEYITGKYIIINQYRLNDDSHSFYKAMREQLSDEGNMFDPIASQLPGNLYCVNDPSVKVLGLFEASSFISETFRYSSVAETQEITYSPYTDLDYLPGHGEIYDQIPFFW